MKKVIGLARAQVILYELRKEAFALLWDLLGDGARASSGRDLRLALADARKLLRDLDRELDELERNLE